MATYTSVADEEFFGAIGRLVISWAHIETGMDLIVAVAYHDLGGDDIEEKPWSLDGKIKFLRKCFSRLDGLAALKDIGPPLLTEVKDASKTRQKIIHGFIIDHPEGAGEAEMIRLIRGSDLPPNAHEKFKVSTSLILQEAVLANNLATRSLGIGTLLLQARAEILDRIDNADRELPS
jgi:hypothetical protein